MNSNLSLYKIFAEAASSGSFSGAARSLYISQPAVSQAIKQLETELEVMLFSRGQKGIRLTKEGEVLYGYVCSGLNMISAGEEKVTKLRRLSAGELRIGASDTVCKKILLPCIEKYHRKYPEISIKITNRTSLETVDLLKSGQIDIGFVNLPLQEDGIIFEKCFDVHDIFVSGNQFADLREKTLSLEEITKYPLIMLEKASNSRLWVDNYFLQKGVILQPQIEMGAHDLLSDYAGIGLGIACVIREFSEADMAAKGLFEVRFAEEIPPRSIGVCYLKERGIPMTAKMFLREIKKGEQNKNGKA